MSTELRKAATARLMTFWAGLSLLGLAFQIGGCVLLPSLIDVESLDPPAGPIDRVAVMPFRPQSGLARTTSRSGMPAWEAADLVTRFVSEAVAERGVAVASSRQVEAVLVEAGWVPLDVDPATAAPVVARVLGASALLVGEVARYRERVGGDRGAVASASVAFDLTLHEAPSGRKLWTARFDQTQSDFAGNPLTASRYPGGGTRFLTAAELARWGAELAANAMPLVGLTGDPDR